MQRELNRENYKFEQYTEEEEKVKARTTKVKKAETQAQNALPGTFVDQL